MRDNIFNLAEDKSCILAVTPDRGGSWWATLRPDTPRNFKKTGDVSWTWTGFSAASNVIGSDDFEFEVIYRLNALQSTDFIFYHSDTQGSVNVGFTGSLMYLTMGRVKNPETGTRKNAGALQSDFAEFSAIGEWVSVVIRRVSGVLSLILNGRTINTTTVDQTDVWYSDFDPISNFDGNMRSAKLLNLTTGETVWSASRAELYETQNPWPSATPINFATQSYKWDSFNAIQNTVDFSHDFTFEIEFECTVQTNARIFYISSTGSLFGLYHFGTGLVIFTTCLLGNTDTGRTYTEFTLHPAGTYLTGRHVAKMVVAGNTATGYLDDVVIGSANAAYVNRVTPSKLSAPASAGGYIYSMRLTDDTTGETVFSYPSEAERVQLLTKTNVRTDRGAFEAADTSKRWSVATQLRAESLLPKCTIIVEVDNPNGEIVTFVSCAQRANPTLGFFVIRKPEVGALLFGYSGKNSSGAMVYPNRYIRYPDGKHVFAFVLDYSALQLRIYIDGAEVVNRAMDVNVVAPPEFDETVKPVILGVTSTSDGVNSTTKISHCLIFDRALTAAEIAAFIPRREWVIPVSSGNINIVTVGFQGLRWTFPDGSTSTASSINQTVTAGTVVCKYVGLLNAQLTINNSTALASSAMRAIDLPRVTNTLQLYNLPGLTGSTADLPRVTNTLRLHSLPGLTGLIADLPRVTNTMYLYNLSGLTGSTADLPRVTNTLRLHSLPGLTGSTADLPRVTNTLQLNSLPGLTGLIADLPRVTNTMYLYNLSGLTGSTADLPRVTNTMYLYNLSGLTGSTADLPSNTGERRVYSTPYVTGALSVVATNTPIYYYATGATALEYDETVHNCVVAGGTGKTLHVGTGTSAGDADIQTLRDRGWSVTIH